MINTVRIRLAWMIASFFGAGFFPKAPGTFGSLAAMPFAYFCWSFSPSIGVVIFFATLFLGTWAADVVVKSSGVQDNQKIVIDEVLGILLTTSVLPFSWLNYGAAFILFRLVDITKPFPANWVDKHIKGGIGAIADDLVAAVWSTLAVYLLLHFGVIH
jgi:phosphatidylglycerophosphatase A